MGRPLSDVHHVFRDRNKMDAVLCSFPHICFPSLRATRLRGEVTHIITELLELFIKDTDSHSDPAPGNSLKYGYIRECNPEQMPTEQEVLGQVLHFLHLQIPQLSKVLHFDYSLTMKCLPWAHVFKHRVPSWWHCFGESIESLY